LTSIARDYAALFLYRHKKSPAKPKLDPFIAVIDDILRDDKPRPKKQKHTAKRVFERLPDEYGLTGSITIVKDAAARDVRAAGIRREAYR
jgi:transposase